MRKLAIIGSSGMGKESIWIAETMNCFSKIIILDDNYPTKKTLLDKEVVGKIDDAIKFKDYEFCIAIGDPRTRKKIFKKLSDIEITNFSNLIHSSAILSPYIKLGIGNIIGPKSVISVEVTIGDFNIINNGSTVAHDCEIANFCTIAPMVAISGNVILKELVEIGTGASLKQGLKISEGTLLGMGATLINDINQCNEVHIGSPAKYLRSLT